MKYSVNYSNKINIDDFDEIIIRFEDNDIALTEFLTEHAHQQVVVQINNMSEFSEQEQWRLLNAVYEQHKNLAVCLYNLHKFAEFNAEELRAIAQLNVPWFSGNLISTFDQLNYMLTIGASQVYIVEDLGFDLRRAKRVCSSRGAQIRVFPNVAQASVHQTPALKKFFIRPEDLQLYSDCIDIVEFWGPTDRQAILRRIYEKGRWPGDLSDLILDFDLSIDSNRILNQFGEVRKSCGRKCMKGDSCSICEKISSVAQKLKAAHIQVKH